MVLKYFIKKVIDSNKEIILQEILEVKGLIQLLMKHRNTGMEWTRQEKKEIKTHLKHISKIVPALVIFLLPGGSFLLPLLAMMLDRRNKLRE